MVFFKHDNNRLNKYIAAIFFAFLSAFFSFSQHKISNNASYEIGLWKNFKKTAVCFTFDDGTRNQYSIAIPMFDQYGFKLTMFTVINWPPDWTQLKKASLQGHEIASHTLSHASLGSLSDEMQTAELSGSQKTINGYIGENKCLTIAYPNCVIGNSEIVKKYYIAARGCQGYIEQSTPSDLMNVSSIICGINGSVKTENDFISRTDSAIMSNGFCVFLIHALDNDSGYSPLESKVLKQELEYLKKNDSKVWVSTFGDIARYIKERDALTINEISIDIDRIVLKIETGLDPVIYNYPVSIRRIIPKNWNKLTVTQNGKEIESKIVKINSAKYISFNAIPDDNEIVIMIKK